MCTKVRSPGVIIAAILTVLSSIPTIAIAQQSTPTNANPTVKNPKSFPGPETTQDVDPFATNPAPEIKSSTERDPFDPFMSEVAKSRDEPIDYASLKSSDLEKAEAKLRSLRVSVLQSELSVLQAKMEFGGIVGPHDLRLYAETVNDLVTLELEFSKTSSERQVFIQKARAAWRNVEKFEAARSSMGGGPYAALLHAANQRLRWEQALVKELRSESSKKKVVPPTTQHSSTTYPIVESPVVHYPNVQPPSIIVEQPNTYYHRSQPSYRYQRNYRTR